MREIPATLGEYVAADWDMKWSCNKCALGYHYPIDLAAAVEAQGVDCPTHKFTATLKCDKCGERTYPITRSPDVRKRDEDFLAMLRGQDSWGKSQLKRGI